MLTRFLINFGEKKKFDREAFAVMSGGVGIICNILLAVFKFAVGKLSGSISITADALNNLSDVASNGVTIVGARLSKNLWTRNTLWPRQNGIYFSSCRVGTYSHYGI